MPPKIIKLGKRDDIASVVKQIKGLRDREVIFELEGGSLLLKSSDNLKLMKKTGEVMGKRVWVSTEDEIGMILAKKAGVLHGDGEVHMPKNTIRVARSDVKPRFSDIMSSSRSAASRVVEKAKSFGVPAISGLSSVAPKLSLPKFHLADYFSGRTSKIVMVGLAVAVLAIFLLAIFVPAATVTVFARSEIISRDFEIAADRNLTAADHDNLEIPAVPVATEKSLTKNFPATGTKATGEKATGQVSLYNFTSNTIRLRADTTTLVADGKKYFFTSDVSGIRPTQGSPEQPTQSSLIPPVAIVAAEAGESYNLPANTRFQIINAALGDQNVYAINSVALSGGQATLTKAISQEDLDRAVGALVGDILNQTADAAEVRLIESGVVTEVLAQTSSREVGDEVESFDMTVIVRITGLGFRDSDVVNLIDSKINEVLSADKYLPDNANHNYTARFKTLDQVAGRGVLAVHYETQVAYRVNNDNLSKLLAGKNESEIKEILLSKPEVDNVSVKFWPEWLARKAPRMSSRIEINTVLADN